MVMIMLWKAKKLDTFLLNTSDGGEYQGQNRVGVRAIPEDITEIMEAFGANLQVRNPKCRETK